ncbi:MAG: DUF1697 domain-containing protein [Acidimicrobiales bacterium]
MARTTPVVALLRGVNVGGHQLSMAALRTHLEQAGCSDVATYIQSGNVVLTPPKVRGSLDAWLSERIGELAGFAVPTVTRTRAEFDAVVDGNPYPTAEGKTLHVIFYGEPLPAAVIEGIDLAAMAPEECSLAGRELYLHLPNGMGRAVLPVAVDKAGRAAKAPTGTARNWNTVLKLQGMLHERG